MTTNAFNQGLIDKCDTPTQDYELYVNTNGKLVLNRGYVSAFTSNGSIPLNQWNHLVLTNNAGTYTFYLNNSIDKTAAGPNSPTDDGSPFSIAVTNNAGLANWYKGFLDEIAVYPTALTAAQVANHYNAATLGATTINWTWQNEIESGQFGQTDLEASHVRVFAKTVQGEAWDYPAAEAAGLERYRHVVDRTITSNAQANIRAANELILEQRKAHAGQIHVPVNPGLELLDIVTVIDSAISLNQLYRCQAISAVFDVEKADFDMTLGLTGV